MKDFVGDESLNSLPTKVNYGILDNAADTCESSPIYKNIMSLLESYPGLENVFDKIHRALCYIYNENKTGNLNSDGCDYLYFWLCDLLYRNLTHKNSFHNFIHTIDHILQNVKGVSICNYNKYNKYYITEQNFMDMKTLFDYSKDYDRLHEDLKKYDLFCNSKYKELLAKYANVYKKLMNKCPKIGIRDPHCNDFNDFFNRSNRFEISELSCAVVQNGTVIAAIEEEQRKSKNYNLEQNKHMITYRQILEYEFSNNPSATSSTKSMVIAPLVIGIAIFSILMCKFTPFGYWIKKALLGKSKRKWNIIMDRNVTEDYSIPEDIDSPRRFNVTYSNI